ncbi:MAG TPA: response regulator [Opitutales bacterium]|nr:response regulator [Opitutales bacterium]
MAAARLEESLLDLFRSEAAAQSRVLAEALAVLATEAGGPKQINLALEAAHALQGAARLVGLDLAAQLAEAMASALSATLEPKQPLSPELLAALEASHLWLAQFSQFPTADLAAPSAAALHGHATCLHELRDATAAMVASAKKPAKKSPVPPSAESPSPVPPPAPLPHFEAPPPPPASKLDFSLLDLYRSEAETQVAGLAQGIVELEGDLANPKKIEPVMRAAHSLKGAARIIGLDLVVQLAHTMEDALVAAQQGRLALDAAGIDSLLKAGDWIAQFSQLPQEQLAAPPAAQTTAQAQCLADLRDALSGKPASPAKEKSPAESPKPAAPPETANRKPDTPAPTPASPDSVVRISAASLSRLMGLAAETLIEARRLEPFRGQLLKLKNQQRQFVSNLEAAEPGADLAPLRAQAQDTLAVLREQLENFDHAARRGTLLSGKLYQEVIASRLRPFGEGVQSFPRLVRDVCRTLGKQARLEIEGRETPVDRDILEKLEAPLGHLLRNACDHGLENSAGRAAAGKPEVGVIRLEARHRAGLLVVQVGDDGHGISIPRLREKVVEKGLATAALAAGLSDDEVLQFLFLPGFSTAATVTEISGRGVGLDVVQDLVRGVGGAVRIYTSEGRGTVFSLQLPVTRSVISALLVEIAGEGYAFPLARLHRVLRAPRSTIDASRGHPLVSVDGFDAALVCARAALGLPPLATAPVGELTAVVVGGGLEFFALAVDRILGETDLVVRPLDPRLGQVPGIQSAAIAEDGAPILIIDVDDLQPRLQKLAAGIADAPTPTMPHPARPRILLVDDSATVRETARKILSTAGFDVETAVDGADGWNAVRVGKFDLVVSDVDMPRLDGLAFVARLRADARLRSLPVVMVSYKDREEDRARGLAAGANVYLAKSSLTDDTFLRAVCSLLKITA